MIKHTCIWLQQEEDPVSWCEDQISDDDIQYILVSKYEALEKKQQRLLDYLSKLVESTGMKEDYQKLLASINSTTDEH